MKSCRRGCRRFLVLAILCGAVVGVAYSGSGEATTADGDLWQVLYLNGRLGEAAAVADSLVSQWSGDSLACFKAYVVNGQLGRYPDTDHLFWCALGSPAQAAAMVDWSAKLVEANPKNAQALLAAGSAALAMRDAASANSYLRSALDAGADKAFATSLLGSAEMMRGNASGAEEHFREAMRADPRISIAAIGLGVVLEAQGQPEAACVAFQDAIHRDSLNAAGYYNLGRVRCNQGDVAGGTALIRRAIAIYPGYVQAHLLLAGRALMAGGWAEAVAECEPVLSEAPRVSQTYVFEGIARYRMGQVADARQYLEKALVLTTGKGDDAEAARMVLKQIGGAK